MKLTKFGILVNKTMSLFTSILEIAKFPGGVQKFWKFRRGGGKILGADFGKSRGEGGAYGKSLPWGGVDIFWNHTLYHLKQHFSILTSHKQLTKSRGKLNEQLQGN